MNLSPDAFFRVPPSPLAPSVISMFVPNRVVGWNCTNSMSFSGTPAFNAIAAPSPVLMWAFVERSNSTVSTSRQQQDLRRTPSNSPVAMFNATQPTHRARHCQR